MESITINLKNQFIYKVIRCTVAWNNLKELEEDWKMSLRTSKEIKKRKQKLIVCKGERILQIILLELSDVV
jgi:hypothetical protein